MDRTICGPGCGLERWKNIDRRHTVHGAYVYAPAGAWLWDFAVYLRRPKGTAKRAVEKRETACYAGGSCRGLCIHRDGKLRWISRSKDYISPTPPAWMPCAGYRSKSNRES